MDPIDTTLAWRCISTIRALTMDAVEQAQSGHPGTPMALAPAAYLLWTRFLRFNPANPDWADRDRFVLSCGHASMLLYSMLHLTGYDLPLDEIRHFRQWGSRTPGHPERGHTAGVEVTTGPLGQGVGNAVGMAIAERILADRFNRPGFPLMDHRIWGLVSDGDLMEGVASEAASIAGHLRLDNLKLIYDDNHITIDGHTGIAFSEDVGRRFEAYGWRVLRIDDGNDLDGNRGGAGTGPPGNRQADARIMRTLIGDPAPTKRDTPEAHGAPLGAEEVRRTKEIMGWPANRRSPCPPTWPGTCWNAATRGALAEADWDASCPGTGPISRIWPGNSSAGWPGSCLRAGMPALPGGSAAPAHWRRGRPPGGRSTRWPRHCPSWSADRPTWRTAPEQRSRARATCLPPPRDATSTGVSASTAWPPP